MLAVPFGFLGLEFISARKTSAEYEAPNTRSALLEYDPCATESSLERMNDDLLVRFV